MAEFEKLQELWQHQRQRRMPAVDAEGMTRSLAKYARRQSRINFAKVSVVAMIIGFEVAHLHPSAMTVAGLLMIAAMASILLAIDWRGQRAIARLNFAEPTEAFVRSAIDRLMEQREPFRKYYWPFLLSIVGGMNLMFLGATGGHASAGRYALQIGFSALAFGAYEMGRRFRIRRFEAECRPLVERLLEMRAALEEDSE
jgi:hypothetical protein